MGLASGVSITRTTSNSMLESSSPSSRRPLPSKIWIWWIWISSSAPVSSVRRAVRRS